MKKKSREKINLDRKKGASVVRKCENKKKVIEDFEEFRRIRENFQKKRDSYTDKQIKEQNLKKKPSFLASHFNCKI